MKRSIRYASLFILTVYLSTFAQVTNNRTGDTYSSIQTAIDSSSAGDTLTVDPGIYKERIVIEKPLILRGATYSVNKNGYTVPSNYAWDETVESIISNPDPALTTSNLVDITNTDNVTFEGFVVQSLNALSGSKNDHLLRIYAHNQGMDNIIIRNNIIGPNTNTSSQEGTNGRMGLYLAAPNYSDFDITNSTFSGNKIFDCKGNGNNVFIWGGAESYLNGEWLELTGTVLENNEIYGSHRSGIEIAGGVDDLTIRNNKIYNNGGTADADTSNLKYGNGILIIRTGGDKSSSTGYGADNITIRNNEIYNNQKNGIYLGPINSNHTIDSNNIHDNGYNGVIIDLEENYHGGVNPVYNRVSSIVSNNNTIINNSTNDIKITGTPSNGFILDAENNWWGDTNPSDQVQGSVDFIPFLDSQNGSAEYPPVRNQNTSEYYFAIQEAIDSASGGNQINIDAGTYDDTLLINKRIILNGSGSGSDGTIIQSTSPVTVTGGATYPSGYRPVIRLNASGISGDSLTLKNLRIRPRQDLVGASHPHPGILFKPNIDLSYIKFDNIQVIGTSSTGTPEMGIVSDGSTGLNHLTISNSKFNDMGYGLIFFNDISDPTALSNFKVLNSSMEGNALKGFYTEKLSDAKFRNLLVNNNGDTDRSPSWADANNSGIDINLKNGTYSNIEFSSITFSNNGTGSSNGTGLSIKARGTGSDVSYSSNPATLSDINISGCVFNGEVNAISIGESSKDNTEPGIIAVNNCSFSNSVIAVYDNRGTTADTIDATGNWWGVKEGPDDNSSDGTSSHNTSSGQKIYEPSDKKIVYAPWYYTDPDDDTDDEGVNQQSAKVFSVIESVPLMSTGYINKGIQLASTVYVDTIDVQISSLSEIPEIDRKVVLRFAEAPTFDSLDVSRGDLELLNDVTISGTLNMSNGNIMTGNNTLIFGTSATIPTESDSAKIIGTVQVQPRSVGTGTYSLLGLQMQSGSDDVGNVSLTRKSGSSGTVTVQGNAGIEITWDIDVDTQPASGRDITFSWPSSFDNGVDPTSIIIYRNTGSGWEYYAGPLEATGNPRQVSVNITGFSSWTIGGTTDPLPVELVDFNAATTEEGVSLNWTTATEVNNYGFEIERASSSTTHVKDWETLGFVPGHGNSNSPKSYVFKDDNPPAGELEYRLKQIDTDGSYEYYATIAPVNNSLTDITAGQLPTEFSLEQNYPNPFNPTTTIRYSTPELTNVRIDVYNSLGELLTRLVNREHSPGNYKIKFDGSELTSGIYFYKLVAGNFVVTKKLMLVK